MALYQRLMDHILRDIKLENNYDRNQMKYIAGQVGGFRVADKARFKELIRFFRDKLHYFYPNSKTFISSIYSFDSNYQELILFMVEEDIVDIMELIIDTPTEYDDFLPVIVDKLIERYKKAEDNLSGARAALSGYNELIEKINNCIGKEIDY